MNRERFLRSPRGPWFLLAAAIVLAAMGATVLLAGRDSFRSSTNNSRGNASASPSHSRSAQGRGLTGHGPFIIYTRPTAQDARRFLGIDISEPRPTPIELGVVREQITFDDEAVQGWGSLISITTDLPSPDQSTIFDGTHHLWTVSRHSGLLDLPLEIDGAVMTALPSPDGTKIVAMWLVPPRGAFVDVLVIPTDGSRSSIVGRYRDPKDEKGLLTPVAWLPDGGWLAVPICCDADAQAWYTISASGQLSKASWLGVPTDYSPGVSADGRYISLYDQPLEECRKREVCAKGPVRILVADMVTHRVQVLGRYSNQPEDFEGPHDNAAVLSPDGSLVAASVVGSDSVKIFDRRTGKLLSEFRFGRRHLKPLAFVDNGTLLLANGDLVLARGDFSSPKIQVLAHHVFDFNFRGWIS